MSELPSFVLGFLDFLSWYILDCHSPHHKLLEASLFLHSSSMTCAVRLGHLGINISAFLYIFTTYLANQPYMNISISLHHSQACLSVLLLSHLVILLNCLGSLSSTKRFIPLLKSSSFSSSLLSFLSRFSLGPSISSADFSQHQKEPKPSKQEFPASTSHILY